MPIQSPNFHKPLPAQQGTLCRWGILGPANIARKNWQSIHDSGNGVVSAVASRDRVRSQKFVDDCQQQVPFAQKPQALGSYEELIHHPEVDALYIPLPTGVRKEWALKAAAAGKHLILEKPVGISLADVLEIDQACTRAGVQWMDGVMFNHSPRLARIREILDDGKSIGEIRSIASHFSFLGDDSFIQGNIRTDTTLEPHGCLGDLGWYCIRFALFALRGQMPREVMGRIVSSAGQRPGAPTVPTAFQAELRYSNNVVMSFHCSFEAADAQWVMISGTRGYLQVRDFVLPFHGKQTSFSLTQSNFEVNGCQFDMHEGRQDIHTQEPTNNAPGSQESNLFKTLGSLALTGRRDRQWPEMAIQTQQIMEELLHSASTGRPASMPPSTNQAQTAVQS